jgi:hypothetical protein
MRFHSKFWGHLFIKEGDLICDFFFHVEISQITMPLVMLLVLLESLDESLH